MWERNGGDESEIALSDSEGHSPRSAAGLTGVPETPLVLDSRAQSINSPSRTSSWRMLMMFFSFARNSSSTPLFCGFTLGFIRSPKNRIARFQRSSRQNLVISSLENQLNSLSAIHCLGLLTVDSQAANRHNKVSADLWVATHKKS
jgi:hypothetical protein